MPKVADTTSDRVPAHLLAIYSLPTLPLALVILPIGIVLPAFYESYTTASLAAIGFFAFASRAFDAVTDPMIGFLSDRTRSPIGRRKPWVLAGAVVASLSLFQLFTPEPTDGILHYAVWSFALYVGFTLIDIPQRAWGIRFMRTAILSDLGPEEGLFPDARLPPSPALAGSRWPGSP